MIIKINEYLVTTFGGAGVGVRNRNLLESCVLGIDQEVFGTKLYPTPEDKIAFVVFSIIANHIFIDGNKRTGVQVLIIMSENYGIQLHYSDDEMIDLALSVAKSQVDCNGIKEWILSHESVRKSNFWS